MRFQKYPRWVDQAALAHELAGREYQVLLECPAQNFRPALYIVADWCMFCFFNAIDNTLLAIAQMETAPHAKRVAGLTVARVRYRTHRALVVVIRGTLSLSDLLTDATAHTCVLRQPFRPAGN
jgi:hypothetical protein